MPSKISAHVAFMVLRIVQPSKHGVSVRVTLPEWFVHVHPVRIARIRLPRFVPRVGLPRNRFFDR